MLTIAGSGTFDVPAGYLLQKVQFEYKLETATNWATEDADLNQGVTPKVWSKTQVVTGAGKWQIHAVLVTLRWENGQWKEYQVPTDVKSVQVPVPPGP